jgi:integrase
MRLFTNDDISKILDVNNTTITDLVNSGKIPYKRIEDTIRFCPEAIGKWLLENPVLTMDNDKYIERFRKRYLDKVPEVMKAIKKYGEQFSEPHNPKCYYLCEIKNKKHGFLYYVRYLHNGKLVYSQWNTRTNNYEAAEKFAIENRDRILEAYFEKKENRKQCDFLKVFREYYGENSSYLTIDAKRGRVLSEDARRSYHNFINKQFVPYLKKQGIKTIEQIDTPFMSRFQNYMLADRKIKGKIFTGVKPQTLNHYISYISKIFDHLLQEGMIKTNPCKSLITIKIRKSDVKITGCYEVDKIKGVFNRKWRDELSYLLSLIIYSTNLRNSEIERVQVKDFFMIDQYHFLDIPESKSENGEREVPIHDFVYRKIMLYVKKNNFGNNDFIFKLPNCKKLGSKRYKAAYTELAGYMGYDADKIEKENIRFYSGRHFWKTLMNRENLGDIEEYFMGHKVSGDVEKLYKHLDKQGKRKRLEKTRKVFQILDKYVFT